MLVIWNTNSVNSSEGPGSCDVLHLTELPVFAAFGLSKDIHVAIMLYDANVKDDETAVLMCTRVLS